MSDGRRHGSVPVCECVNDHREQLRDEHVLYEATWLYIRNE